MVDGAKGPEERLFGVSVGVYCCWRGRLDGASAGALAEVGRSRASEKASVVDVKDCVSAVAVALWDPESATEAVEGRDGNVGWESCVGVVKV